MDEQTTCMWMTVLSVCAVVIIIIACTVLAAYGSKTSPDLMKSMMVEMRKSKNKK